MRTLTQIVKKLNFLNGNHKPKLPVVFSGGEPALELDRTLLVYLYSEGFTKMHIETNGGTDLRFGYRFLKHIVMSPKQSRKETKLLKCHDLKILFPFINKDITVQKFKDFPCERMYLQPIEVDGINSELTKLNTGMAREYIAKWNKENEKKLSLSCQMHKYIGAE